jgi:hypothetical protein
VASHAAEPLTTSELHTPWFIKPPHRCPRIPLCSHVVGELSGFIKSLISVLFGFERTQKANCTQVQLILFKQEPNLVVWGHILGTILSTHGFVRKPGGQGEMARRHPEGKQDERNDTLTPTSTHMNAVRFFHTKCSHRDNQSLHGFDFPQTSTPVPRRSPPILLPTPKEPLHLTLCMRGVMMVVAAVVFTCSRVKMHALLRWHEHTLRITNFVRSWREECLHRCQEVRRWPQLPMCMSPIIHKLQCNLSTSVSANARAMLSHHECFHSVQYRHADPIL